MNGHPTGPSHPVSASHGSGATGLRGLYASQGRILLAFIVTLVSAVYYITSPLPAAFPTNQAPAHSNRPGNLHLLIPASKADPNLCKVLLSAAAAGYPSPVVINWGQTFDDTKYVEGGSHLAKIRGVHEYLVNLTATHDEDLVLMVDGYDIWLQLRPQVLVDRFYAINARADERIRSELKGAAETQEIKQEIVFGCQKRCWPWNPEDPPCYAVPQSNLVEDIYGPETDVLIPNTEYPFQRNRQRFLNSGVAMGTVRAMRKLFGQALVNAEFESNFGSDQYIFSHIFGDQEVYREMVRRDSMSFNQQLYATKYGFGDKAIFNRKHIEEVRKKAAAREDHNYEFGIGVDYGSEIGLNTVFAEDDTAWLYFNDTASLMAVQNARGIPFDKHRTRALQDDISRSLPPYWTFSSEELPRWTKWEEVQLLTDVYTGITPVVIHHNAHRDGLKSLRQEWWNLLWSQKHARTLYDAFIYAPVVPVAVGGYPGQEKREYWPLEIWKGGARFGPGGLGTVENWIRFDEICHDYSEQLFRDGKGPWELPEHH